MTVFCPYVVKFSVHVYILCSVGQKTVAKGYRHARCSEIQYASPYHLSHAGLTELTQTAHGYKAIVLLNDCWKMQG